MLYHLIAFSAALATATLTTADVQCMHRDERIVANQCIVDMFTADPFQNICGPCGCSDCALIQPAKECTHPSMPPGRCAQRTLKGLGRLTASQIRLEENFGGTFEECVAHMVSLGQSAGAVEYTPASNFLPGKCVTFTTRICWLPGQVALDNCPTPPTEQPTESPTELLVPSPTAAPTELPTSATADVHCMHRDERIVANQCILDMFAADPFQNICGPCGCSDCALIQPPMECTIPGLPAGRCAQSTMKSSGRLTPRQIALEENFTGTMEECVEHLMSLGQGAGAVEYTAASNFLPGKCVTFTTRMCWLPGQVPLDNCPTPSTPSPTEAPSELPVSAPTEQPTTCTCRQTDATHAQGARCMGPNMESIGYRQTANWCCSDYGCSKGYQWIDAASNKCLDDTFVGTCMFTFIQNGGCNMDSANNSIVNDVDADCFTCDNIGDLVEQECTGGQRPVRLLGDMVNDARRLATTPLPTSDNDLKKMNKRISKIRSLLKQQKDAARAALNGSTEG